MSLHSKSNKYAAENKKREWVFKITLILMIAACLTTVAVGAVTRFSNKPTPKATYTATKDEVFTTVLASTADSAATIPTTAPQSTTVTKNKKATTAPATTQPASTPFATAATGNADYGAQWSSGSLIAIDAPDYNYSTPKINLTDEDRDLLERLCYGEFGNGGFVGAALIAQCVKDAMISDGIPTIAQVIDTYVYTGRTDIGTSDECRAAVRYIFDENQNAVQHRIMYMYNPYIVESPFHESQNYILSYQDVRFFDRVGY